MKDPFERQRIGTKKSGFFLREELLEEPKYQMQIRPEKSYNLTLKPDELGSVIDLKVKRQCTRHRVRSIDNASVIQSAGMF